MTVDEKQGVSPGDGEEVRPLSSPDTGPGLRLAYAVDREHENPSPRPLLVLIIVAESLRPGTACEFVF